MDNVVLLDVTKAFDNVEWDILYRNMEQHISKFINNDLTRSLIYEYFILLQNRKFVYRKTHTSREYIIDVNKGISQGLPSSNVIFTILLHSVVCDWGNSIDIIIHDYIILNIYIDDFYIKFINPNYKNNNYIINTLIKELEKNKLNINYAKSLADIKVNLNFNILKNTDKYLGIPFTRIIILYQFIILDEYKKRYNNKIIEYELQCTWEEFYDILTKKKKFIKKNALYPI